MRSTCGSCCSSVCDLSESLDDALRDRIRRQIREGASPHHVPRVIVQVADIPRTISGKITELAVRDVIHGRAVKNTDAMANPQALELFRDLPELARPEEGGGRKAEGGERRTSSRGASARGTFYHVIVAGLATSAFERVPRCRSG